MKKQQPIPPKELQEAFQKLWPDLAHVPPRPAELADVQRFAKQMKKQVGPRKP